jgi:hypothetical protein
MTQHVLLKLLDGSDAIVVRSKKKSKKRIKKTLNPDKPEKVKPLNDENEREGVWNDINEQIQENKNISDDMDQTMQYEILDATSEPAKALGAIQLALHGRKR